MSDRRDTDHIGRLLDEVASHVEHHVTPPDVGVVHRRSAHRRSRSRKRRIFAAGTALVVVAGLVVTSVGLAVQGPSLRQRPQASVPSYAVRFGTVRYVVKDLPALRRRAATIAPSGISTVSLPVVTPDDAAIAFGAGRVWVLERGTRKTRCALAAVDPASVRVVGKVALSACPDALAYGAGSVWLLSFRINVPGYDLVQVDPSTLRVQSTTVLDGGPGGVVPVGDTGAKYVFVTVSGNDVVASFQGADGASELVVVTATSHQVLASKSIPAAEGLVTALTTNSSGAWMGTESGWVLRADPATAAIVVARHLGTRVVSLAASGTAVWATIGLPVPPLATYPGLDLVRLDPRSGSLALDTGLPMLFVATDGSSLWALGSSSPYSSSAGLVGRLDTRRGTLLSHADLPAHGYRVPDTLGVYRGSAWVIDDSLGTLTKVSP